MRWQCSDCNWSGESPAGQPDDRSCPHCGWPVWEVFLQPVPPHDLDRIGVDGSAVRQMLTLFEGFGHVLLGALDLDHPSKITLVFRVDEGARGFLRMVTIEDGMP